MPIAPRFHLKHIRNLSLQLKRAPETVRLKQMHAIEELLQEISADSLYPLDYVVYRMTGYRGEEIEQPMLLGSALIGDLVATIAVVSRSLLLPAENMLTLEEVAKRLSVSQRTLSRFRKDGFVFYWVVEQDGKKRLGCSENMLNIFQQLHKSRLQTASNFSRLTLIEQRKLVQEALQYAGSGRSLSDVASELSGTSGRGHETIRTLLRRSSKSSREFTMRPPLSRQDARVIQRAIRFGVPWSTLKARYNRTTDALRRSVVRLRATRLKQLEITHTELNVFVRDDAEEVILGAPAARLVHPPLLLLNPLDKKNTQREQGDAEETAVVSAMHMLRRRAGEQCGKLGYSPKEATLDRIETDLRWSFLLQQQLILKSLPAAIAVTVQHTGRPLQELPSSRMIILMKYVIRVVAASCESLDPSKGQTASRTPAAVLDRSLSISKTIPLAGKAAARHQAVELVCPFHDVVPWSTLIPQRNLPLIAMEQSQELADLVSLRFGWSGRPRTIEEIAVECGRSRVWVKRSLRSW